MRNTSSGQELPVANLQAALPLLPVYRRGRPVVLLPLVGALIAVTALMSVPSSAPLFWVGALIVLLLSLVFLFLLTKRSLHDRRATTDFLESRSEEFIEAVQVRYGVTLTEDILYSLAQGGNTALPDKDGEMQRISVRNTPDTTKLCAE